MNRRACVIAAALVASVGVLPAGAAAADDVPPYSDDKARGTLTFCDAKHHEVRGGYLESIPFVAYVVGSQRPKAPYDGKDTSASLFGYQPRPNVPPGEWSGQQLTAASIYTNLDHPESAVTPGDSTLKDLVDAFPPRWDGYLQLRLKYKAKNQPVAQEYAAADIRVTGAVWRLVRGGGGPCDAGKVKSIAEILAPKVAAGGNRPKSGPGSLAQGEAVARLAAMHPPVPGQTALPTEVGKAPAGAEPSSAGPSKAGAGAGSATAGAAPSEPGVVRRNGDSSSTALVGGVGLLALLAGVAAWWLRRRRLNTR